MKFKEKIIFFLCIILYFTISYSLCSSHEITNTRGYISRRKNFCSTPFYVFVIFSIVAVFFFT